MARLYSRGFTAWVTGITLEKSIRSPVHAGCSRVASGAGLRRKPCKPNLSLATFHQIGTCLGLGTAVASAATVPTGGSAAAHLALQVSAALATGSVLLLLALATTAALILPADLAARRFRTIRKAVPA